MLNLPPSGNEPLYQQITETLRREIADGTIPVGTRLPSSRQLANDLRVSRITVVTAYSELEAAGVIEARGGSGTYVLPPWTPPRPASQCGETAASPAAPALPPWQRALVQPVNSEREELLSQVLGGPLTPDTIGFAWGAGDPRLIPMTEFRRALVDVLDRDGPAALGSEGGAGYPPLRHWLAGYLQQNGLDATPDDILVTGGTQQTIALVAATLLRPGDRVITEEPTWPGALAVFAAAGARVIGIPLDREGMQHDRLVEALENEQPRLIYTVPTFQNPTGVVMSARRPIAPHPPVDSLVGNRGGNHRGEERRARMPSRRMSRCDRDGRGRVRTTTRNDAIGHYKRSNAMPFLNVKLIEGVFSPEQKHEMIARLTETMVEIEGERPRGVTWVMQAAVPPLASR